MDMQVHYRDSLTNRLVENLPLLRAKMDLSQQDFANLIGIGRQTLNTIENKKSKMRWDTFLAIMLILTKSPVADELMGLVGLDYSDLNVIFDNNSTRSNIMSNENFQEKLWTDLQHEECTLRGIVPVPVGLKNGRCPKCNSINIRGAIITPTADEQDPNIVCLDCGYWWD